MSGASERQIHNAEWSIHTEQREGSQLTQTINFMHKAEGENTAEDSDRPIQDAASQPSQTMSLADPLPSLHTPHRKRKTIVLIGVVLATLDLCCLPITYYYALNFGTSLNLQDGTINSLCV
jgi:hypothetical protein